MPLQLGLAKDETVCQKAGHRSIRTCVRECAGQKVSDYKRVMHKARLIMLLLLLLCFSSKGAAVDALPQTGTAPASNHMALAAEAKAAAQAGQLKGESALSYQLRTMPGQITFTLMLEPAYS